jgi:hypothetical protein
MFYSNFSKFVDHLTPGAPYILISPKENMRDFDEEVVILVQETSSPVVVIVRNQKEQFLPVPRSNLREIDQNDGSTKHP